MDDVKREDKSLCEIFVAHFLIADKNQSAAGIVNCDKTR